MTMTDEDLEHRLRRDLAELAALPMHAPRERRAGRRSRPALTMVVALAVVLALVAASVAIVRSTQNRASRPAAVPTVHTILEQPSSVTGSTSSIVATPFSQICERWRQLPTGVDCTDLQARYVWSPGVTRAPLTFSAIEVVGTPDKLLDQDGTTRSAYPVFQTISVHGYDARLYGTEDHMTIAWHEGPDLQITIQVALGKGQARANESLRAVTIAFAQGMHRVAINPAKSTYVIRSGANPLQYTQGTFQPGPWTLTWRPSERQLCTSAESMNKCFTAAGPSEASVRAQGVLLQGCLNAWTGTQGVVFGSAPEAAQSIAVTFSKNDGSHGHATASVFTPPDEPHLRVFAAALDHPALATVTALDAQGHALPLGPQERTGLTTFGNAC